MGFNSGIKGLMVFTGMLESFTIWSLFIIPLLKLELQHLAYRTGHEREWSLCWAKNKGYSNSTVNTEF